MRDSFQEDIYKIKYCRRGVYTDYIKNSCNWVSTKLVILLVSHDISTTWKSKNETKRRCVKVLNRENFVSKLKYELWIKRP